MNQRVQVSSTLPFDAIITPPSSGEAPQELLLLLHGFAESGARLHRKILNAIPDSIRQTAIIVAPNAPFPMPVKTDTGYVATYSWYFYDPSTDEYVIDMRTASEFLAAGLEKLGVDHLPKRLIGFSQGGFLAPIAAARLSHVRQFIGIGSDYLVDEIPGALPSNVPYRVDAIHGSLDESVDPRQAEQSHDRLMRAGVPGSFTLLEGVAHRVEDRVRAAVATALSALPF